MSIRIDGALVPSPPPPEVPAPEVAPASDGPSPFAQVLAGFGQRVDAGEGMIEGVAAGQYAGSDPGALIALQAGIYRYSEAVDLVGKLVDRAGNAVRSVLQGGH